MFKRASGAPGDRFEIEADRIAQGLRLGRPGPPVPGGTRIGPDIPQLATSGTPSPSGGDRSVVDPGRLSGGHPLEPETRAVMERHLARGFGQVRVHRDVPAARSAEAMGALSYTVGRDIVFAAGQYAPGTATGDRLIAHELAHVVQQSDPTGPGRRVQRQPTPDPEPTLPWLPLPGGLTLFPSPLRPTTFLGARIPVPTSLRLTNALGLGPGPSAVLDVSPRLIVGHLLENVDLSSTTRPGTPPEAAPTAENQQRISLVNPTVTLDPSTGRLRGWATLSVGTEYPLNLRGPTDLRVEIESTELGTFTGQLGYGPLHADFRLRFHYDTARLEEAVHGAFAPRGGFQAFWVRLQAILRGAAPGIRLGSVDGALQDLLRAVQLGQIDTAAFATRVISLVGQSIPAGATLDSVRTALSNLADELRHPGFTLTGSAGLGPIPLSFFRATAPTTTPLARPLYGAPAAFPITSSAGGVIVAPAGAITSVAVPALGYTRSSFGARSGSSITAALLPTLSPSAISAGESLARQFPVYAYVEYNYVRRVSNDLDVGVRLTVQVSTPELAPAAPPAADPAARLQQTIQDYQSGTTAADKPPTPNVGLSVVGRFNAL